MPPRHGIGALPLNNQPAEDHGTYHEHWQEYPFAMSIVVVVAEKGKF